MVILTPTAVSQGTGKQGADRAHHKLKGISMAGLRMWSYATVTLGILALMNTEIRSNMMWEFGKNIFS